MPRSSSEIALTELLMASLRLVVVTLFAAGAHAFVPVAPNFRVQRPASRGAVAVTMPSGPPGGAVTPSQFGGLEYLGAGAAAGLVPAGALIALRSFLVSKRGLNND